MVVSSATPPWYLHRNGIIAETYSFDYHMMVVSTFLAQKTHGLTVVDTSCMVERVKCIDQQKDTVSCIVRVHTGIDVNGNYFFTCPKNWRAGKRFSFCTTVLLTVVVEFMFVF